MSIPPFHWWRTVFYLIPAISLYTLVLGALSIGSSFFTRNGHFAHRCARWWSRLILGTTGVEVDARGLERIDPARSCIIVSNHQSIYDIPVIFWTLPIQLRIIAKASLGRFPVLGWHLRRTGHVLVQREHPGAAVFERISRLLGERSSLLVFPEGTRSVDGRLGRFRGGIFRLAIESGLPVVPIAVEGSRHVMRKGRLMTCPGRVQLAVGDAIDTTTLEPDDAKALAANAREQIDAMLAGAMSRTGRLAS